jgi:hypothetical protein
MSRAPATALGLVLLLAAGALPAQTPEPTGTVLRLGFGVTKMDFTCSECEVDAETGITAFAAVSTPIGDRFTAGLDVTFADAGFGTYATEERHAKLLAPVATAGLQAGTRRQIWGTLGFGWMWYSGIGPKSNGPALSLRAGYDLAIGSLGFVTPYVGYMSMVGHDGPEIAVQADTTTPPFQIERTRLGSFQLGVALTPRL